ncbi:MAG TPA: hypothetical protein VIB79_03130 [Candidatus Binatia bacterium]
MKRKIPMTLMSVLFVCVLALPPVAGAEELLEQSGSMPSVPRSSTPGFFDVLGSVVFSIFHVPYKLASCVGGQAFAGTAYVATFGVPGSNEPGGNLGREIGEVGRKSCTGTWFITPDQVARDYND